MTEDEIDCLLKGYQKAERRYLTHLANHVIAFARIFSKDGTTGKGIYDTIVPPEILEDPLANYRDMIAASNARVKAQKELECRKAS